MDLSSFKTIAEKSRWKVSVMLSLPVIQRVATNGNPKVCTKFALEEFCKFGDECAYNHKIYNSAQIQKQLGRQNEQEIQKLKDEVSEPKFEIKQLTSLTRKPSQKPEDVTRVKQLYKKVLVKCKFKCDQCECRVRKETTLRVHKNTKRAIIDEI